MKYSLRCSMEVGAATVLACVALCICISCQREVTTIQTIPMDELYEATNNADVAAIRSRLANELGSAGSLVLCSHTIERNQIKCTVKRIIKRDDSCADPPCAVGSSIPKHERSLQDKELLAKGMITFYSATGDWIGSSAIHDGRIKRMHKSSAGQYVGHEFTTENVIEIFESPNKASEAIGTNVPQPQR